MTAPAEPLALDGHTLTVDIIRLPEPAGQYRMVATCECLYFARQVLCPSMSAALYAEHLTIGEHQQHLQRITSGWFVVVDRPDWLDPQEGGR